MAQNRLRTAISESHSNLGAEFCVDWKPFQIDPDTDPNGERFAAYCDRRWGGSGWTNHLRSEGRKDNANFSNWKWWPNTTKAHQFVSFASQKYGVSTDATNQFLFDALYEKGENISLTETLVRIGFDSGGILAGKGNTDELRSFLERDEGKDEMFKAIKLGRSQYSITSVPFFIIEREGSNARPYGLSGAQKSSAFRSTFEKLMATAGKNKDSD